MMMDFMEDNLVQMTADLAIRIDGRKEFASLCGRLMQKCSEGSVCLPLTQEECDIARQSSVVGNEGLFVLDENRFYTRRNWLYEQTVRNRILAMASTPPLESIPIPDDGMFALLNPAQKQAIQMMCERQICLLTGGPGTGKTFTIARAVKLIQECHPELPLRIVAPTAKAAMRVQEAMLAESRALEMTNIIESSTIHKLIGANSNFTSFKHNHDNPLHLGWLIVDESSMIDLPLMVKLLDALPETCRITLVGDPNQLASVEPGRLFGDLCNLPQIPQCRLTESKRFPKGGEIYQISEAINAQDSQTALQLLKSPNNQLIHYMEINDIPSFRRQLKEKAGELFGNFSRQTTPETALAALHDCRILCPYRHGPFGTDSANEMLRRQWEGIGPIPMMITKNNYSVGVSNGDVGVVLPDDTQHLWLPAASGTPLRIPLNLLPDIELAFASSIHKAQGSEYENVIIILPPNEPPEMEHSLLTKEILYTALTRTEKQVFLYASDNAVVKCCHNVITRYSGL